MHIGRAIIIPAILALGASGSILAGSAVAVSVAQAPAAHAQLTAARQVPNLYYHT
jgi:hypothetical protein